MSRSRTIVVRIAFLLVIGGAAAALTAYFLGTSGELASRQLLHVALDAPQVATLGDSVPVEVSALGPHPLERVELWIGAVLVDVVDIESGDNNLLVPMSWFADAPGNASAMARVFDSSGAVGNSNTAKILVGSQVPASHWVDAPTTLSDVAEQVGADLDEVAALNPSIGPAEALPAGSSVLLPVPNPVPGPGVPSDPIPLDDSSLQVVAVVEGCEVVVTVTGLLELGQRPSDWSVRLLRHPGQGQPLPVAEWSSGGTEAEVVDMPGSGEHRYSATEVGGAVSGLTAAEVGPGCPSDDPVMKDGFIQLAEEVDGVFLYLTFDDRVQRVPESPKELVPGDGRNFDLRPHLPQLPAGGAVIEVWGRTGGEVDLLGALAPGGPPIPVSNLHALIETGGLKLPVFTVSANTKEAVEFEWSSNVAHHGVRWFLASQKPGKAGSLYPVGLKQTGTAVPVDGFRRFEIDLEKNQVPTVLPAPIGQLEMTEVGPVFPSGERSLTPVVDPPGTAWAWVVPVDEEGQIVGPPSDPVPVLITQAPFDPSDAPPYDVVSVNVHVPPAPNKALLGCTRIVSETPRFPLNISHSVFVNSDGTTTPKAYGGIKISGALPYTLDSKGVALYPFTACPGERGNFQWGDVGCGLNPLCHVSKSLSELSEAAVAFGEFLVGLANKAADAYNDLKAWAIDQVASVLCPEEVAGECKTLIKVGVDVMLTAVGVPPTVPNFDDLAMAAKGELVDVALDQLGVGAACNAVAGGATGKTCGDILTQLDGYGACALAPEGKEESCQEFVEQAKEVCDLASQATECEFLTASAQDLVEEGFGVAYDESLQAIEEQITKASLEALGFGTPYMHASPCHWGGLNDAEVFCPPLIGAFGSELPAGCYEETFGADAGRILCNKPSVETVAIPEPRGQHQPIRVDVLLTRNENPLPDDFSCPPISAVATTVTPYGATGQPYLPASEDIPTVGFFGQEIYFVTLWLSEPNPHVEIPAEKKPPLSAVEEFGAAISGAVDPLGFTASSDWRYLLEAGSAVGVKVNGPCIAETQAEGPFGVVDLIPDPLPRMTPGES
jgi:hypothetical protein